ncbi:MAG: hypothetical protein ACFE9C_17030 [Candidatus Hodarchaeota archaeon]
MGEGKESASTDGEYILRNPMAVAGTAKPKRIGCGLTRIAGVIENNY